MIQDINWSINCTDAHSALSDFFFQGLTESFVSEMTTPWKTKTLSHRKNQYCLDNVNICKTYYS